MKRLITIGIIIFSLLTVLYVNGLVRYKQAIDCSVLTDSTDLDICNCNKQYGYNLDWFEEPTNTEIILSNFQ